MSSTSRSRSRGWLVRSASVVLLIGSVATGQNRTEAELPMSKQANLSSQETLEGAKDYVSKMQDVLRRVVGLQETAKKQKDIIKLNCVNDKLLQVKGHLAVSDKAMASLNEAIAKVDDAGRRHEYSRLTILNQKVSVLGTEATNCVGEEIGWVGEGTVQVEIDNSIPAEDVTAPGLPQLDTGRPPQASAI